MIICLVAEANLAQPGNGDLTQVDKLIPYPETPWFEHILTVKAEKKMELFRVLPGANLLPVPDTPELVPVNWRDAKFDTD